jgi:hypothetical protein
LALGLPRPVVVVVPAFLLPLERVEFLLAEVLEFLLLDVLEFLFVDLRACLLLDDLFAFCSCRLVDEVVVEESADAPISENARITAIANLRMLDSALLEFRGPQGR